MTASHMISAAVHTLAAGARWCAVFTVSAALCITPAFAEETASAEEAAFSRETGSATVEYSNLSQLLIAGNLDLQEANDSYNTNKQNYQEMMETLRDEQDYMKLLAEKYKDTDPEAYAQYKANAAALGQSASQLSKRIEALNRKTSTISVTKNIDAYTMTAQTQMNSYNQMILNVAAREKSVEAAESVYQATLRKQAGGAATEADVMTASDNLLRQQNLLASYQQQAAQLRFNLLSLLGITDSESVTIGTIPEPDLAAIDAIDFEADCQKAIGNNSSVQNARHANAGTYTEITQKTKNVAEAEGSAQAEITDAYQQLLASRASYTAAQDAYESSRIAYQSLQLKKQAGMLNEADYLQGEAEYLEALAAYQTASMNLYQTYENYCWSVKGIG